MEIVQKLGLQADIALSKHNIGVIYSGKDSAEIAKGYFVEALNIFQRIKNRKGESECYRSLGEAYEKLGNADSALILYERSLEISEQINESVGTAKSLFRLSRLTRDNGDLQEALSYGVKSYDIAMRVGNPEGIRNASEILYGIYKETNKTSKALEMLETFKLMNDSLYNIESNNAATRSVVGYEFQLKEEKLKQDREQQELIFENKAKNQRNIVIFSIIFLAASIVFSVVLYRRFKLSQKQAKIISEKEEETAKQKEILEEKNTEITDSIRYARRIQSAILPSDQSIKDMFPESFVYYKPKDIVAGDFYWFDTFDKYKVFTAADCTGHGVPGALVSVVCHNALNRALRESKLRDAGAILDKTREIITHEFSKSTEDVNDGMNYFTRRPRYRNKYAFMGWCKQPTLDSNRRKFD